MGPLYGLAKILAKYGLGPIRKAIEFRPVSEKKADYLIWNASFVPGGFRISHLIHPTSALG